jgi:hypothetical protein
METIYFFHTMLVIAAGTGLPPQRAIFRSQTTRQLKRRKHEPVLLMMPGIVSSILNTRLAFAHQFW